MFMPDVFVAAGYPADLPDAPWRMYGCSGKLDGFYGCEEDVYNAIVGSNLDIMGGQVSARHSLKSIHKFARSPPGWTRGAQPRCTQRCTLPPMHQRYSLHALHQPRPPAQSGSGVWDDTYTIRALVNACCADDGSPLHRTITSWVYTEISKVVNETIAEFGEPGLPPG